MKIYSQSRSVGKLFNLILLCCLSLFLVTCANDNDPLADDYDQLLQAKEQQYVESLNFPSDANVKLIGFKTVYIDHESLERFNEFYYENQAAIDELHGRFYNPLKGEYRTYFPLKEGIIAVDGHEYQANDRGDAMVDAQVNLADAQVVGRIKTKAISGVPSNIVTENRILLRTPVQASYTLSDNVVVFDFGRKDISNHDHHGGHDASNPVPVVIEEGEEGGKVSCMANHVTPAGVAQNCTTAGLTVPQGRCPFNPAVCMDYNGWFTDCVNYAGGWGKYSNFIQSDCDVALANGNCWNEIM